MEKRYIEISNIVPAFSLSCTHIVMNKHTGVYSRLPLGASILQAEHEGYLFIHVDFKVSYDSDTEVIWALNENMTQYVLNYIIQYLNSRKEIPMRTRA